MMPTIWPDGTSMLTLLTAMVLPKCLARPNKRSNPSSNPASPVVALLEHFTHGWRSVNLFHVYFL